jgi:diguanylate cyclase (GGDEF)-like protein
MKNVLYVDDIESNLFTLKSVLKEYNVFTASSAPDGFEILKNEKIDIILLDIMMPDIDGFQMAKIISKNSKMKNIPFIFVTAKKDDETIEKCFEYGAVDYISKPFNETELIYRIKFHIKHKELEEKLRLEYQFLQNVFDLQENFLIITNGETGEIVNKAVLNFFNLQTIEEFREKYKCICNSFEKEEGCFYLDLVPTNQVWTEYVISLQKDVIVKIKNRYFILEVIKFQNEYIISLTDITDTFNTKKQFEHKAHYDALTKIYNREMFNFLMEEKLKNYNFKNSLFVILDIDFFKKVNDTYGHLVGDKVLIHLAQLVKRHIRDNDIFARWGGEEFVIVMDTDLQNGKKVIENIRKAIEEEDFEEAKYITCSFGITEINEFDDLKSVTKRADEALYEAKQTGRNKVCIK